MDEQATRRSLALGRRLRPTILWPDVVTWVRTAPHTDSVNAVPSITGARASSRASARTGTPAALAALSRFVTVICCGLVGLGFGPGASACAEGCPEQTEGDAPMIRIETDVVIEAPIEDVFDFVTSPENDVLWLAGVVKAEKTSEGPTDVGATSTSEIHFLGMNITTGWEVTEYDPPNHIKVKSISGPVPIQASHSFETTAEGGTRVKLLGEAEVGGFFRLGEPIVGPMVQRQWETSYLNLKDVLEAGH